MPSLQPSANMTASPVRNASVSSSRSEENDMSSPNSIYSETAFMRLSPGGNEDAPLKHTSGAIIFWFMIMSFERPSINMTPARRPGTDGDEKRLIFTVLSPLKRSEMYLRFVSSEDETGRLFFIFSNLACLVQIDIVQLKNSCSYSSMSSF